MTELRIDIFQEEWESFPTHKKERLIHLLESKNISIHGIEKMHDMVHVEKEYKRFYGDEDSEE